MRAFIRRPIAGRMPAAIASFADPVYLGFCSGRLSNPDAAEGDERELVQNLQPSNPVCASDLRISFPKNCLHRQPSGSA